MNFFNFLSAACNSLWPEFEMINEDESEYDMEMLEDDGCANSLISRGGVDDTVKSLLDSFEVLKFAYGDQ